MYNITYNTFKISFPNGSLKYKQKTTSSSSSNKTQLSATVSVVLVLFYSVCMIQWPNKKQ